MSRKRSINAKTRAQRGASLPLALLLFLICSLLAAVVLAASTAEAGRHSQLVEMDQRYYSVVSAANALKKEFNGESNAVTVTVEKTQVGATRDADPDNATVQVKSVRVSSETSSGTHTVNVIDNGSLVFDANKGSLTLPELTAVYTLFASSSIGSGAIAAAQTIPDNTIPGLVTIGTFYLTPQSIPSGVASDALDVTVTQKMAEDEMTLQFDSKPDKNNQNRFSLSLNFGVDIDADDSVSETRDIATGIRTKTTTTTVKVTWDANDLTKAGA